MTQPGPAGHRRELLQNKNKQRVCAPGPELQTQLINFKYLTSLLAGGHARQEERGAHQLPAHIPILILILSPGPRRELPGT